MLTGGGQVAAIVLAFVVGTAVGGVLTTVIWRIPRRESLRSPGPYCPTCQAALTARQLVPVASYLRARGRCAAGNHPIGLRYPLVELLTGGLFALMVARLGVRAELPAYLYLAAVGVALSVIDIDHKRLPNVLVLPSYLVLGVLLGIATAVDDKPAALVRAVIAMAISYGVYLLVALINPKGMGFGDVKLAGVLGLALGYLGWGQLVVGLVVGVMAGALTGLVLLALRLATRSTAIPFGPFLLLGAAVGILAGHPIAHGYLQGSGS